jgi:hypothetical protein
MKEEVEEYPFSQCCEMSVWEQAWGARSGVEIHLHGGEACRPDTSLRFWSFAPGEARIAVSSTPYREITNLSTSATSGLRS